jgi:hypothetical protein
MDKILVVYHPRGEGLLGGTARRIVREISWPLLADVEEIRAKSERGFLDHLLPTRIETPRYDPAEYDLVVLGAPVLGDAVSAPVERYLREVGRRIRRLAVIAMGERANATRLARRLASLSGRVPIVQLALPESEEPKIAERVKCERFVEAVRLSLADAYARAG